MAVARRSAAIEELATDREQLLAESLAAETRERRALAEGLHDGAIQSLLAIRHDLEETAVQLLDDPGLQRADDALLGVVRELRSTVFELTLELDSLPARGDLDRHRARSGVEPPPIGGGPGPPGDHPIGRWLQALSGRILLPMAIATTVKVEGLEHRARQRALSRSRLVDCTLAAISQALVGPGPGAPITDEDLTLAQPAVARNADRTMPGSAAHGRWWVEFSTGGVSVIGGSRNG